MLGKAGNWAPFPVTLLRTHRRESESYNGGGGHQCEDISYLEHRGGKWTKEREGKKPSWGIQSKIGKEIIEGVKDTLLASARGRQEIYPTGENIRDVESLAGRKTVRQTDSIQSPTINDTEGMEGRKHGTN